MLGYSGYKRQHDIRYVVSFGASILLHALLIAIVAYFLYTKREPKLVKLEPILILKKGSGLIKGVKRDGMYSLNHKNTAAKALKEAPSDKPLEALARQTQRQTPRNEQSKPQNKRQNSLDNSLKDLSLANASKKSLDERLLHPDLAALPAEQSLPNTRASDMQSASKAPYSLADIKDLYGAKFGDLGSAERDFVVNNLRDIGRITQSYLRYPDTAAYLGQSGVNIMEFYLLPNGDIQGLKILSSSGYNILDHNSTNTVELAYKDYPHPSVRVLIRIRVSYFMRH